jgi:hypothetical protein
MGAATKPPSSGDGTVSKIDVGDAVEQDFSHPA